MSLFWLIVLCDFNAPFAILEVESLFLLGPSEQFKVIVVEFGGGARLGVGCAGLLTKQRTGIETRPIAQKAWARLSAPRLSEQLTTKGKRSGLSL